MIKIGVSNIKFAHKGMVADTFFDQTETYLPHEVFKRFSDIEFVQDTAVLTDETVVDDNGLYHRITLDFSVRKDYVQNDDILSRFIDMPVVVLVKTVDGCNYVIGNNQSPAYISKKSGYKALSSREHQISLDHISLDGLQTINLTESLPIDPTAIAVSQKTVLVPAEGDTGIIHVDSQEEWAVEVIN